MIAKTKNFILCYFSKKLPPHIQWHWSRPLLKQHPSISCKDQNLYTHFWACSFSTKKELEKDCSEEKESSQINQNGGKELKNEKEESDEEKLKRIEEEAFNVMIGLDKNHSFKNELIVARENYKKSKR